MISPRGSVPSAGRRRGPMKTRILLILSVWLAFLPAPRESLAADPPGAPDNAVRLDATAPPPATAPAGDNTARSDNTARGDNTWVDRYHTYIERDLFKSAVWFDGFFGDERVPFPEPPESSFRWKNEFRWDEVEGFAYRSSFRVRIRLPRMTKKWGLLISGENRGDPTAVNPEDPGNPGLNEASQVRAAAGELVYEVFRTERAVFYLGTGVQLKIPPNAFARARLQYTQPLGFRTLGRFTATPYWNGRIGFGETNQLDFEHQLDPRTVIAWGNSFNIEEGTPGWTWGSELSLSRRLTPISAITFGGSAGGPTRPDFIVQTYRAYTRYSRSVLRSWLLLELEPDIRWPLDEYGGRKPLWGAVMRLELCFFGRVTTQESR